jgi:mono/diheme cytochrome c family protein
MNEAKVMKNIRVQIVIFSILVLGLLAVTGPLYVAEARSLVQTATDGQAIFQSRCTSCHTIGGGKLIGPDLAGVTTRRDPDWILSFIKDPDKVIDSGDTIAAQLLADHNNVRMPNLGLSDADIQALLAYLTDPTAAPPITSAAALPPGNAQAGQMIFTGKTRLTNGGTNCEACHSVGGNGILGGGSLGPDLTNVYARLTGPGLTAALGNIAFPTMQGPFANKPLTPQEQADIVAYLQWADTTQVPASASITPFFFGAGAAGTILLLLGMVVFWPHQQESLVERLHRSANSAWKANFPRKPKSRW